MDFSTIAWTILLLPLSVAAAILFFFRKIHNVAALLATFSALTTLVLSVMIAQPDWFGDFVKTTSVAEAEVSSIPTADDADKTAKKSIPKATEDDRGDLKAFPWINVEGLKIDIGLKSDRLSQGMMLIVTFIGFLVHLFSLGYMKSDDGKGRYFGALALFMFSMTGIVLANNFVMMFIFWELVGVSSYLLISHWYQKPSAADAAKKAFLTNRIGDFGFMFGILLLWKVGGSFFFDELNIANADTFLLNLSVLLIFCGAIGKSAQVPLHVWLPDAMEGPTPVSALIHAATMVAAGVFMMARIAFVVAEAEVAAAVIAWVGAITALVAALMALQQSDIKKILAYSTLSQLGYMIMAQGFGEYGSAHGMFHLYTHAFFKALLFLGAGAVIYACHHEQNIWKMGGLWKKLPITGTTFAIGTAALIAVPFTSGFWSKEHILIDALNADQIMGNKILWGIGLFVALLTPFYMTRLFVVAFLGKPKDKHSEDAKEVGPIMFIPLVLLAAVSLVSVYIGVPDMLKAMYHSIDPIKDFHLNLTAICSMVALAVGVVLAFISYAGRSKDPFSIPLFRDKFYIDELYAHIVDWFQDRVGGLLNVLDKYLIEPVFSRIPAMGAVSTGSLLRLFQVGNLQTYVFYIGLAVLVLILLMIVK